MLEGCRARQPQLALKSGDPILKLVDAVSLEEYLLSAAHPQMLADRRKQSWSERVRDGIARDTPVVRHGIPMGRSESSEMKGSREVGPRRE